MPPATGLAVGATVAVGVGLTVGLAVAVAVAVGFAVAVGRVPPPSQNPGFRIVIEHFSHKFGAWKFINLATVFKWHYGLRSFCIHRSNMFVGVRCRPLLAELAALSFKHGRSLSFHAKSLLKKRDLFTRNAIKNLPFTPFSSQYWTPISFTRSLRAHIKWR